LRGCLFLPPEKAACVRIRLRTGRDTPVLRPSEGKRKYGAVYGKEMGDF